MPIFQRATRLEFSREPFTRANPLASGKTYRMLPLDTIVYVAAGATVYLPDRPIQGREYLIKVASGSAETTPVQVFAPTGRSVEDPGTATPYTYRSGGTPATIALSAACNGWRFDGAAMHLTR